MPCIIIRAKKSEHIPNLEGLSEELADKLSLDINKINILVEYFDEQNQFTGMNPQKLIIALYASKSHEKSFIKNLMESIAELSEKYFNRPKGSAEIMCHLIESGQLFADNKFI